MEQRRRLILNGGGRTDVEAETDQQDLQAGRPAGGAGRPHMLASRGLLRSVAFWCILDPFQVVYVMDNHDVILQLSST